MKPRRSGNDAGSLDSLLDTMTNVVGILVIVLVITQLQMSEAVKRVQSALPEISAAQLQALQAQGADHKKDFEATRARLKKVEAEEAALRKAIDQSKKRMTSVQAELAGLAQQRKAEEEARALQEEIDRNLARKQEVAGKIAAYKKEAQGLVQVLRKIPRKKDVPPRVVRLPNPTTAPAGAGPRYFICRYGKLYYVDEPVLKKKFDDALARAKSRLEYRHPKTRKPVSKEHTFFDWEKLKTHFERFPVSTGEFRLQPRKHGDIWNPWIPFTVDPDPTRGESAVRLNSSASRFRKLISRELDKKNVYFQFLVYPDSFAEYLKAREILEEYKKPAGWVLKQTDPKWFGSGSRLFRVETIGKTRPPPKPPSPPQPPPKVLD